MKPFGYYFWSSNGDGTESPSFCKGEIPSWRLGVRDVVPLYEEPSKERRHQFLSGVRNYLMNWDQNFSGKDPMQMIIDLDDHITIEFSKFISEYE